MVSMSEPLYDNRRMLGRRWEATIRTEDGNTYSVFAFTYWGCLRKRDRRVVELLAKE